MALFRRAPAALLVCLCLAVQTAWAGGAAPGARHDLAVTLDPAGQRLSGRDRVTLAAPAPGGRASFRLAPQARVLGVTVEGRDATHGFSHGLLTVETGRATELVIAYTAVFDDPWPREPVSHDNPGYGVAATITPDGAFFLGGSGWRPRYLQPGQASMRAAAVSVDLSFSAPAGILAVTDGELLGHSDEDGSSVSRWRAERAEEGLALAAGRYVMGRRELADGTEALTYLSQANAGLAETYLEATARHLDHFQDLHGPYAYPKFAVVENFFPTGYGMPSWTLLGGRVLRLPFIPETSLRHEVAHAWWGNGVRVAFSGGNWCEGLATYLADHARRDELGQGAEHRLETLREYARVARDADLSLAAFRSRTSALTSAVGYGKSMMVFHMLRRELGDAAFYRALRQVYADFLFREAAWTDLLAAFARAGGKDAAWAEAFLDQWVRRPGGPALELTEVLRERSSSGAKTWDLAFTVRQKGKAYALPVPYRVTLQNTVILGNATLDGPAATVRLRLPAKPLALELDPASDLFRLLDPAEVPATVDSLKGATDLALLVTDPALEPLARLLAASLGQARAPLVPPKEASGHPGGLLLVGPPPDNLGPPEGLLDPAPPDRTLFTAWKEEGRVLALFLPGQADTAAGVERAARLVTHYGKYSRLVFAGGRNLEKTTRLGAQPLAHTWEQP